MNLKITQNRDITQRTYAFALMVIKFVDSLDKKDCVNKVIINQLIRCATSIGANVIEAQAGSSKLDFRNFLSHALKSANETIFWLNLLKDSRNIDGNHINPIIDECNQIAKILGKSVITLRNNK